MEQTPSSLTKASLAMIGTMIGAGVFALPAMFAHLGLWRGSALYWFIALIVLATHCLYLEIALSDRKPHHLAGYAGKILGPWGRHLAAVTYPLHIVGANVIYILLGGQFLWYLGILLGIHAHLEFWQLLFWVGGAITVFFGLAWVAKVEALSSWLLMAGMVTVVIVLFPRLDMASMPLSISVDRLAGVGVFLFALSGYSILGEVVELVARRRRQAYQAVFIGTLSAALLSWLFALSLVLASHGRSIEFPSDLMVILPQPWRWLLPIVGFLSVATAYINTAQDLRETLQQDFRFSAFAAWVTTMLVPYELLTAFKLHFLPTVSFVGAVFTGANGLLIALSAWVIFRRKKVWQQRNLWLAVPALISVVYLIAMAQRFVSFRAV